MAASGATCPSLGTRVFEYRDPDPERVGAGGAVEVIGEGGFRGARPLPTGLGFSREAPAAPDPSMTHSGSSQRHDLFLPRVGAGGTRRSHVGPSRLHAEQPHATCQD